MPGCHCRLGTKGMKRAHGDSSSTSLRILGQSLQPDKNPGESSRPSGQQLRMPDGRKCGAGNVVRQVEGIARAGVGEQKWPHRACIRSVSRGTWVRRRQQQRRPSAELVSDPRASTFSEHEPCPAATRNPLASASSDLQPATHSWPLATCCKHTYTHV